MQTGSFTKSPAKEGSAEATPFAIFALLKHTGRADEDNEKKRAMLKKIRHIGLAVSDLEEARTFFGEIFDLHVSEREEFGELRFSFIPFEGTDMELLQSTTPEGQIAKFISKRGQGIHHIALEVDDIQAELDRLKSRGVSLINDKPYLNAHKEQVAFIHPKSTFGVLIELVQSE